MIAIRSCTQEAMKHVSAHLSKADELEVLTVGGETVERAIRWGRDVSTDSFAIHPVLDNKEDDPVALFGVVDDEKNPGHGVIWMVTTPMLLMTSRDILKEAPHWLNAWMDRFPKGLHNLVDSRNERHIRWLRKMGAKFSETTQDIRGVPFYYFHITRGATPCAPPLQS